MHYSREYFTQGVDVFKKTVCGSKIGKRAWTGFDSCIAILSKYAQEGFFFLFSSHSHLYTSPSKNNSPALKL